MHFMLVASALVAAILAMAVPPSNEPFLTLKMSDNATDVLAAHGIWAPDAATFAQGKVNTADVDFSAQSELLAHSGIEIKDLVYLAIDTASSSSTNEAHPNTPAVSEKGDCDHCTLCLKACAPMLLLYPFCAAACFNQWYCTDYDCGPHIGPGRIIKPIPVGN